MLFRSNDVVARSSPVQTVSGGTNWKQVSVNNASTNTLLVHVAAIKNDGTLWVWGGNNDGVIGDDNVVHRSSPVQTVAGGTNWKQVSAGGAHSTAAIKTDGTLWVWGGGDVGELGTNDAVHRSSPVQTVSGGTNWKQIGVGTDFIAAVREDYWA